MARIAALVRQVERRFALEVSFLREPSESDLDGLLERIGDFCTDGRVRTESFGNLATLTMTKADPGVIVVHEEEGDRIVSRLAVAQIIRGGDKPDRHIAVRMPFADGRAEAFLKSEARQLPQDGSGLIMVDLSAEMTAFRSWAPVITSRFRPGLYTRVGGLCLFAPQIRPINQGLMWLLEVQQHLNPHAKIPLVPWVQAAIAAGEHDFKVLVENSAQTSE